MARAPRKTKPAGYLRVFGAFGVAFGPVADNGEAVAEACPWCGGGKLYASVETGQYECKRRSCGEKGDHTTFLTWYHGRALGATTTRHYVQLGQRRGIAWQTLQAHGLAYDSENARWLVPFRGGEGSVVNLMLYDPDARVTARMLPGLPVALYNFDKLRSTGANVPVMLCDGPFNAIACDYAIGAHNRPKYAVVAVAGAFKAEWAEHFRGRRVRALTNNDEGGERHNRRLQKVLGGVAAELLLLRWPEGTRGKIKDINDLVKDNPDIKIAGFVRDNSFKFVPAPRLGWDDDEWAGGGGDDGWVWPNRVPCGSYVSFSGRRGTMKSTLVRELVARFSRGEPLPGCGKGEVGVAPAHVILITAEDSVRTAAAHLKALGAVRDRVKVLGATLKDGDALNVLEHLGEIREKVREYGTKWVVIDGLNSVVGAPNISTDMRARSSIVNKLHQFAQRERVCLMGLRNEDVKGRAYGPASMADLARCILRAVELPRGADGNRYFELLFERVSDRAPSTHPPISYSVRDLSGPGGGAEREILWGKAPPWYGGAPRQRAPARGWKAARDRPLARNRLLKLFADEGNDTAGPPEGAS